MGRPQPVALQMMIDWHGLDTTVEVLASETEQVFAEILGEPTGIYARRSELIASLEANNIPKAIATSSGPKLRTMCLASAIARTILVHFNVRRRTVRQTRSGGISARRADLELRRRDDGVGRQRERMPGGGGGGRICSCRARAA